MALELVEALKQEELAEALVERLSGGRAARGVLEPAVVVVQNAGLGRWLCLWQARRTGISAAIHMPFARAFIARMLEAADLYSPDQAIDGAAARWRIFKLLLQRGYEDWGATGAVLRSYLAADRPACERRAWQLACQLADLYDQYAIYRPEWLQAWLNGMDEFAGVPHWSWQARLFRELAEDAGLDLAGMQPRLFGLALNQFCRGEGEIEASGNELHVFGISSFPPAFLQFFARLGRQRSVTLYHLVCSQAFLGELPRNFQEALLEGSAEGGLVPDLNNPMLVASGQAAARFQSLLLALDYPAGDQPAVEADEGTDLHRLQVSLRQNLAAIAFVADGTVSIHACHSRRREVQVLQQQLLALFEAHADLRPEDVMVMAPEIGDYVDAIEAVFGEGVRTEADLEPARIPFCVADRRPAVDENCWRFLMALLELIGGRQTFSHVSGLLDFEPVRSRLQATREELGNLLESLQNAGVRWGIDAAARVAQGQPEFDAFSWNHGLTRIFDGLIYPTPGPADRIPCPVPGKVAELVGTLTQMLRNVFRVARDRSRPRSFAGWTEELLSVARTFLDETGEGAQWMRTITVSLGIVNESATDIPIQFETFHTTVSESRHEASGPSGLLRRGVTFCRLQPVRHIPAKVICILGLNEGDYPRQERPAEFDLIDFQRRNAARLRGGFLAFQEIHYLGDHRLREEDRQLFLDCVLNARERLYLSYVGQNDKSNQAIPPSLLISELLQFLEQVPDARSDRAERRELIKRIHVRHPLQEWSVRNYLDPQPAAGEPPVPLHFGPYLERERVLAPPRTFLRTRLPAEDSDDADPRPDATATPEELIKCFKDPAAYYLRTRLQVDLDQLDWESMHEDVEALELDPLASSNLRVAVHEAWQHARRATGNSIPANFRDRLRRELMLPPGQAGELVWRREVVPVLECLEGFIGDADLQTFRYVCELEGGRFTREDLRLPDGRNLIVLRGSLEKRYLIEARLRHVCGPHGSLILSLKDRTCVDVGADDSDEAQDWLREAVAFWRLASKVPQPLSMQIGFAYVARLVKAGGAPPERANLLDQAYGAGWAPFRGPGDGTPSQRLCFDGDSPAAPGSAFRERFMELAERLLLPVVRWAGELQEGGPE